MDGIASFFHRWGRLAVRLSLVLALLLGLWGWSILHSDRGDWADDLFRTVQLAVLQFQPGTDAPLPWQLDAARFLVPVLALLALYHWVGHAIRDPNPPAALGVVHGQVVVVPGKGSHAHAMLRDVQASCPSAVILAPDVPLDPCAHETWHRLGAGRAASIVVCRDNDIDNLNIVTTVAEALGGRRAQTGPMLIAALENETVAEQADVAMDNVARQSGLRYRRLSVVQETARAIFLNPPLPARKSDLAVPSHIVVVGLGPGAHAVLRHALTIGQDAARAGPTITVLGTRQELAAESLLQPDVVPAHVATMRKLACDPFAGVTEATLHAVRDDAPMPTLICVCLPDEPAAILGITLARQVTLAQWPDFAIAVHQSREDRFLQLLARERTAHGHARLCPFGGTLPAGTLRQLQDPSDDRLACALYTLECEIAHQFSEAGGAPTAWDNLPEAARHDNRTAVDHLAVKVAALGCRIVDGASLSTVLTEQEFAALARIEHRRWAAQRVLTGWRLGERDNARRTHPDLVPFDELPEPRQDRYDAFARSIPALLAGAGLAIERNQ